MKRVLILSATVLAALTLGSVSAFASGTSSTTAKIGLDANGDIALTSAPSIDFDRQAISVSATQYKAKTVDQALEVQNPGLGSGWTVTVARTDFTGGQNKTLKGASLTLANGKLSTDDNNQSGKPTLASKVDLSTANTAANVMSAAKGDGIGRFNEAFSADDVSLAVPAGNTVGDYTAQLTWTLTNTPPA